MTTKTPKARLGSVDASVRDLLAQEFATMKQNAPQQISAKSVLLELAPQMLELSEKGYTFEEIASKVSASIPNVTPAKIKAAINEHKSGGGTKSGAPRRKRRTKAEIEAEKAEKEAAKASGYAAAA